MLETHPDGAKAGSSEEKLPLFFRCFRIQWNYVPESVGTAPTMTNTRAFRSGGHRALPAQSNEQGSEVNAIPRPAGRGVSHTPSRDVRAAAGPASPAQPLRPCR